MGDPQDAVVDLANRRHQRSPISVVKLGTVSPWSPRGAPGWTPLRSYNHISNRSPSARTFTHFSVPVPRTNHLTAQAWNQQSMQTPPPARATTRCKPFMGSYAAHAWFTGGSASLGGKTRDVGARVSNRRPFSGTTTGRPPQLPLTVRPDWMSGPTGLGSHGQCVARIGPWK
jgi:hypothetical protein